MQITISAICTPGTSLRQGIAQDTQLEKYGLVIEKKQEPGRKPGWLKLHSSDQERGAINVEWDPAGCMLIARVVTKGSKRPSPIVGDFITYLLSRHSTRIKVISTAVVKRSINK